MAPPRPPAIDFDDFDISESSLSDSDSERSEHIFKPKIADTAYCTVENTCIVELCHVQSHEIVYVRPVKFDVDLVTLMKEINKKPTHIPVLPTIKLNIDDIVLVSYGGDYCRAAVTQKVEDIGIDEFQLQLIDFGNTITAKINDLRWYISNMNSLTTERMAFPVTLDLPKTLDEYEISAVVQYLEKKQHHRFQVQFKLSVEPYGKVELICITNGKSISSEIKKLIIRKTFSMDDIVRQHIEGTNLDLTIVENFNLGKGFICCILTKDENLFGSRFQELLNFGRTLTNAQESYQPEKMEICLAMKQDEEGLKCWYRAQYHETLSNDFAQVGLIDFGITANVRLSDIRKFHERFSYPCISYDCKIRSLFGVNFDLLDTGSFDILSQIQADKVRPSGEKFEIFLADNYFVNEEEFL